MWGGTIATKQRRGILLRHMADNLLLTEWQLVSAAHALRYTWPPSVKVGRDKALSALSGAPHNALVASEGIQKGAYIAAYVGRPWLSREGGDYVLRPWNAFEVDGDLVFGVDGAPEFVSVIAEGVLQLANTYRGNKKLTFEECHGP